MTNLSNSNTSNSSTNNTLSNSAKHNVDPKSFYGMVLDYAEDKGAFSVGDTVLCPMTGEGLTSYVLTADPYKQKDLLALTDTESVYYFDNNGFFVRACDNETLDSLPSLFSDTPANRQLIASLYPSIGIPIDSNSNVNVIDITESDDDEIVKVPSVLLSDISCEALGASEVLDDLSNLLYIIINNDLSERQYKAMARLAYDATMQACQRQYDLVKTLNEPLNQSMFGGAEVSP